MENSAAYEEASNAASEAYAVYEPIRAAFQAGTVSDADYLAARAAYDVVMAAYHVAYCNEVDAAVEAGTF